MAQHSDLIKSHSTDGTPLSEVLESIAVELTKLYDRVLTTDRLQIILTVVEKLSEIKLRWEDYEKAPDFPEITLDNASETLRVMDYLNIDLNIVNTAIILIMKKCVNITKYTDKYQFTFDCQLSEYLSEVLNKELHKWNLELQRVLSIPRDASSGGNDDDTDGDVFRIDVLLNGDIQEAFKYRAAYTSYRCGLAFRLEQWLDDDTLKPCIMTISDYFDKQIHDECVSLLYKRCPASLMEDRDVECGFLSSQRIDILKDLVAKGHHFSRTQWGIQRTKHHSNLGTVEILAYIGHVDGLKLLLQHGHTLNHYTLAVAVAIGSDYQTDPWSRNQPMIRFLKEANCPLPLPCRLIPAICRNLELMQLLCSDNYPWDDFCATKIAVVGTPECMEFALAHGCPMNTDTISHLFDQINSDNILPMMKVLYEHFHEWPEKDVFTEACKRGLLAVVQYMFEHSCPYSSTAYQTESLEIIQYLHEKGVPWTSGAYKVPIMKQNMDAIRFLCENGCPKISPADTPAVMEYAVHDGALPIVTYLHEQGFPWNEDVFNVAIKTWNIDIIRYIKDNGCPWDTTAYLAVCNLPRTAYPLHDICEFLYDNGCPWKEGLIEMVARGGQSSYPSRRDFYAWVLAKKIPHDAEVCAHLWDRYP